MPNSKFFEPKNKHENEFGTMVLLCDIRSMELHRPNGFDYDKFYLLEQNETQVINRFHGRECRRRHQIYFFQREFNIPIILNRIQDGRDLFVNTLLQKKD